MATTTTTYSFNKPTVGGDEDAWGGYLNGNWDSVDDLLDGTTPVTGIDINSGSIDGTAIGAASASTGAFTDVTVSGNAIGTITTVTSSSGTATFDMSTTNNFEITTSENITSFVFSNFVEGQSGNIYLNNAGHTISAAATTYINSADLSTISTTGKYWLSYYCVDATASAEIVLVSVTPALTGSGA